LKSFFYLPASILLASVITFAFIQADLAAKSRVIVPATAIPTANSSTMITSFSEQATYPITVSQVPIDFQRAVNLFDEVTTASVDKAIQDLSNLDDKSNEPIYLIIASPGGSVFDGERLISAMESTTSPVYTVCVSLCASMAAVIHQYGKERLAFDRAVLMFHDGSGSLEGKIKGMHQLLALIEGKLERSNRYIAKRSKMTYEQFLDMHKYDLWIEAIDATRVHLNDKIVPYQISKGRSFPSAKELIAKSNKMALEL
jgi:ATP-dependent protease ClpP protease subunit